MKDGNILHHKIIYLFIYLFIYFKKILRHFIHLSKEFFQLVVKLRISPYNETIVS